MPQYVYFPYIWFLCIPVIHFIPVKTLVKTENQRLYSFIFVPALHDSDPLNFPILKRKEYNLACSVFYFQRVGDVVNLVDGESTMQ